jgi:pimeloyl-ACP methyl ester carboxylesterase
MKFVDLHGERVAYREAGAGEALLLIHGMAGSSATWRAVLPCRRNTGWWHRTCSGTVNPPNLEVTIR